LVNEMNPDLFYARIDEFKRGAFPSSSRHRGGGRSAERRLPLPDRFDKTLERMDTAYTADLDTMHNVAQGVVRRENNLLLPARPEPLPESEPQRRRRAG
jgi:hypothetical protein